MEKKFKAGELAKILGVGKSTLLYWESEGFIPKAHRDNTLLRGRWWNEAEAKEIADYRYLRLSARA
jgi:DNA-binding transcriptional MerR regulator